MNLKDLFDSMKLKVRHLTYNEYLDCKFKSGTGGKVFEVEVKE